MEATLTRLLGGMKLRNMYDAYIEREPQTGIVSYVRFESKDNCYMAIVEKTNGYSARWNLEECEHAE